MTKKEGLPYIGSFNFGLEPSVFLMKIPKWLKVGEQNTYLAIFLTEKPTLTKKEGVPSIVSNILARKFQFEKMLSIEIPKWLQRMCAQKKLTFL